MMELKSSYTIAELDVVPDDWKIKRLKDIVIKVIDNRGKTPPNSKFNSSYPLIEIFNFSKNKLNISLQEKQKYLNQDIYLSWFRNGHPSSNSILISTVGNVGLIGITNIKNICIAQNIVGIDLDSENHFKFVANYMKLKSFQNKIVGITMSAVQPSIKVPQLLNLAVVLPPLKEQQKIAKILSTVDEQIEKTDQLIEKTKELKKGLMQQLLTKGINHTKFKQTELGEIPFEWTANTINDVADVLTGGTPLRSNIKFWENGNIPWMSSGEVNKKFINEVNEKITEEGFNHSNTTKLPIGTVMLAMNGQGKTRGTVAYLKIETTCNQSLAGIVTNKSYHGLFLYYYLEFSYDNIRNINGEGRSGLNLKLIRDFKIIVPSLNEQQKIVDILSTVDEDIEGYVQEKSKYEKLKNGLMQQLLTGKTRVKVD